MKSILRNENATLSKHSAHLIFFDQHHPADSIQRKMFPYLIFNLISKKGNYIQRLQM